MSERSPHNHSDSEPSTHQSVEETRARVDAFINDIAPSLGKIMGVDGIDVSIGENWATDLRSGKVTIDPNFFIEQGYTADMAAYGMLHEVGAHLREVVREPKLTQDVINFTQKGKAESIFHNILGDIAGNNLIHATLPSMKSVAHDVYQKKLFPDESYASTTPRHLQFLYKIIRQEMIPDSDTVVLPEVDALIDEFRDYQGMGDMIKHSTQVAKSPTVEMPAREKFLLWTEVIYPRWQTLIELDKQDPTFARSQSDTTNGEPSSDAGEFDEHYREYHDTHHPEPMSDQEHEQIEQDIKDAQRAEAERHSPQARNQRLDEITKRETGHSLAELNRYNREVQRWSSEIESLREVFRSILNERLVTKRTLRGGSQEGVLLDPNTIAQTVADMRAGVENPPAFLDYKTTERERETTGKTDYIFVFDRSGSMMGEKSQAAASSAVICLEALAGMQRDIEQAERETGKTVDLDIRSAVYVFNHEVTNPKPLSHTLDNRSRLDTYGQVRAADGGNADSQILAMIEDLPTDAQRKQIAIILSDGEADDTPASRRSIDRLRHNGWHVYGVSIGSEAAVELYRPYSQRVDDPKLLPATLRRLIGETLL